MATPASDLERLLPGAVFTGEHERGVYARDLWPLSTVRLRRGDRFTLPGAVVRPERVEEVSRLLAWCNEHGVAIVPYGGGSGVCGGVLVEPDALDGREAIVLDLKALRGVEAISDEDLWCTVRTGTLGMDYEDALDARGLTGGHYPQSLYPSTVGGWLACRSAGQASTGYGKGEDLVAGAEVVLASGEVVHFTAQPSTAAGPDLLRLFVGSEGTLGVIVRATMRVFRKPRMRLHRAFGFEGFARGVGVLREALQDGLTPSVVRLYDPEDAALSFPDEQGAVLVVVHEGPLAPAEASAFSALCTREGAAELGPGPAEQWEGRRFHAAYQLAEVLKRDGTLGPNVVADTMEVAGPWSRILDLYTGIRNALEPYALAVLCHASHVYPDGACLYFTFAVQGEDEPGAEERYHAVWDAGMEATLAAGGTITHHHGVGRLKARWLRRELGEGAWGLLGSLKRTLDPAGILNPGNLGL